jgi:hypothetical protein
MRTLTLGIIGAAALTAGLLLVRSPRPRTTEEAPRTGAIPAGENVPGTISLERIRALGY